MPAQIYQKILFILLALFTLYPNVPPALALICGILFGILIKNPFQPQTKRWTTPLLQVSVVGLGAGMNLSVITQAGIRGVGYTIVGIALTMVFGILIGKLLKINFNSSLLISVGTAICGGSAIAAVGPVIAATSAELTVALATVFSLNSIALILFPPLGKMLSLTESQFGLWGALAIHDMSSVVGAALQFGPKALEIATTVKLTRALWIAPLALGIAVIVKKQPQTKPPWFILFFLIVAALVTWFPALQPMGANLVYISKRTLVLTLFLIGSAITKEVIEQTGSRVLIQGIILWIAVSVGSLIAIRAGLVSL